MEQLGFSPVFGLTNKMTCSEAGKVHGCQADRMVVVIRDRFKLLSPLQIK